MLHTLAVAAIALVPIRFGFSAASRLSVRRETLSECADALKVIENGVRYSGKPLYELLHLCGGRRTRTLFERLSADIRSGENAGRALDAAVRDGMLDALLPSDRQVFQALFSALGGSGREQQLSGIAWADARLAAQLAGAEEVVSRKVRVYRTIGALAGAAVVIILI